VTQHNSEQKKSIADKVSEFISNNKLILWSILGLILVLTVVFAVVDKKIKDRNDIYSNTAIEIQDDFQEWFNASEDDKAEAETALLEKIAGVVDTDKGNILVDKALFLRGQFYLQKEEWDNAFADFTKVAADSPDSYLAAVCLYNAAGAKENSGDIQAALDMLLELTENYRSNSPLIPETLFNTGRLYEALDKKDDAIKLYEDLTTSYSSSNWTNLAKTRIISLKASGVSQ